jgi:hypothetical protein
MPKEHLAFFQWHNVVLDISGNISSLFCVFVYGLNRAIFVQKINNGFVENVLSDTKILKNAA